MQIWQSLKLIANHKFKEDDTVEVIHGAATDLEAKEASQNVPPPLSVSPSLVLPRDFQASRS